nr:MAG TPA: hypothetical protein [Caudoviricetes sp.]
MFFRSRSWTHYISTLRLTRPWTYRLLVSIVTLRTMSLRY